MTYPKEKEDLTFKEIIRDNQKRDWSSWSEMSSCL